MIAMAVSHGGNKRQCFTVCAGHTHGRSSKLGRNSGPRSWLPSARQTQIETMMDSGYAFVTPDKLRIGLYVELELGWMSHPFPKGSFKISSARQIETLQGLGLKRVRYSPARSDPEPIAPIQILEQAGPDPSDAVPAADLPDSVETQQQRQRRHNAALISQQREQLALCDQQFDDAIRQYRGVLDQLAASPLEAAACCHQLVGTLVGDLLGQCESSIRLLSESTGDRAWMHPVNVTVLSLLLGKAIGMRADALRELGIAAFLHDIGKNQLADRVRLADTNFAPAEYKLYQSHVAHSVAQAMRMQLPLGVQRTIGQHHEMMDGSGFPKQSAGDAITQGSRVLALVNRYENMCNPARPSTAVTPHEALSLIFAQMKNRFDTTVLAAFIRMMGVYPPGSVVMLSDGRYALVVSVNSARPLKPRVIVHEPAIAKEEALILDLEHATDAGIRRSIRPDLLPRASIDYLSPRQRICYFFERAAEPTRGATSA